MYAILKDGPKDGTRLAVQDLSPIAVAVLVSAATAFEVEACDEKPQFDEMPVEITEVVYSPTGDTEDGAVVYRVIDL